MPVTPSPAVKLGQPGNKHAAEAAAYKREVRDRLIRARADGATNTRISEIANENITPSQIMDILEGLRVPIAVYRVLAAALDKIET